jgi:nucleoside phosphorylase/CheY-like chemotaxis protein
MIDILIVEDHPEKLEAIKKTILEINSSLANYITHAESIIEAKKILESRQFDILIIDLVIPLRKAENPDAKNCCAFIQDIESSSFLKEPLFIVGLTQFQELNPEYSSFFEDRLYHLLNYEISSEEWKGKLKKIIYHLYKTKEDFLSPKEFRYKYDAAFICALYKPEFEAVYALSPTWNKITHEDDPTIYYETILREEDKEKRVIAAFADQMGMVSAAALSTKVILKFKPKYLFMTGIAAGVRKTNVNFGDILVADLCWDYSSGKITEFKVKDENGDQKFESFKFEAEPRSLQLKVSIKNKLQELCNNRDVLYKIRTGWKGFKVTNDINAFIGPVASGSQVVASSERINEIKGQNRKLIGIEMEAYGISYACTHIFESKITPIIIKSICDFGDEDKDDKYQEYAAYTSAHFARHFLLYYLD